jgi:hypothetical protein
MIGRPSGQSVVTYRGHDVHVLYKHGSVSRHRGMMYMIVQILCTLPPLQCWRLQCLACNARTPQRASSSYRRCCSMYCLHALTHSYAPSIDRSPPCTYARTYHILAIASTTTRVNVCVRMDHTLCSVPCSYVLLHIVCVCLLSVAVVRA